MKNRSRTEYSILNITTGIGGYIFNTIIGFVCRTIFVRCLSADYLGVNGLFTNIISMLSLSELGIGSAIVFSLYKPLAENNKEKITALMQLFSKAYKIIGISIALLGIALIPFLDFIIKEPPNISEDIKILYLISIINTSCSYFFSYRSSLLIAAQKNFIVVGINYIITIIQSLIQILILILFKNYLAYLFVQTIGIFTYNFIISYIAKKQFNFINHKQQINLTSSEKKSLFSNIRDLSIYKFSGVLVNSTDNIIITYFDGLDVTGIASNYTLFINTLESILSQIFNGITASIGNHNVTSTTEEQFKMFNFLNMLNFWFYCWGAFGIYYCSTDLVLLFFGKDYLLDKNIIFMMALNFFSVGIMNTIRTYKHTLGLFHYGRFIQFFTGILNIIFSIILGKYFGLFGILFATFIARILTNIWYDIYAVYKFGFNKSPIIHLKKSIIYFLIMIICILSCEFIFSIISINSPIFNLISKIILCSLIVNAILFVSFFKTKEFELLKQLGRNIIKKILKK